MENYFEKTPIGALNAMAAITLQVLVNRGMPKDLSVGIVNEILELTTKVITGKQQIIITDDV